MHYCGLESIITFDDYLYTCVMEDLSESVTEIRDKGNRNEHFLLNFQTSFLIYDGSREFFLVPLSSTQDNCS